MSLSRTTGVRIRRQRLSRHEAPPVGMAPGSSIVFPILPVRIRHDRDSFIADSTIAVVYLQAEPFERECLDPHGVASDWIELPAEAMQKVVRRLGALPTPLVLPCAVPVLLLERLMLDEIDASADPLWLEEAALLLLDRLIARPVLQVAGRHAGLANAAKAIIARNPGANISLSQLAAALGVSPFHLCHVFTACTGMSLSAYRDQLRVRIAVDELARGGVATSTLAGRLGYRSPRVFRRRFRQLTGLTIADARSRTASGKGPAIRQAVFSAFAGPRIAPDP